MTKVVLFIYDLSQGMARQLSLQLTGKQIDAIYHTSVVVFGVEVYFGQGISVETPGSTAHGVPIQQLEMGTTSKTRAEFDSHLNALKSVWTADRFVVVSHKDTICLTTIATTLRIHFASI